MRFGVLNNKHRHVEGCCTWHAALKHLQGMVQEMEQIHKCCERWQPDVLWQCPDCTALCGASQPTDACQLCFAPYDGGSVSHSRQPTSEAPQICHFLKL